MIWMIVSGKNMTAMNKEANSTMQGQKTFQQYDRYLSSKTSFSTFQKHKKLTMIAVGVKLDKKS